VFDVAFDFHGDWVVLEREGAVKRLAVLLCAVLLSGAAHAVRTSSGGAVKAGATVATLSVSGPVSFAGNSVVDAFNASFGSVTAGSTSTLTWTEVTDRLNEFVTSSFTAVSTGFYEVAVLGNVSQTAGTGCILLKVNGNPILGGESCNTGVTALASVLPVTLDRILKLNAGDILRVDASATTANGTFQKMQLMVKRVP
jgi:hypothetical protein